MNKRTHLQESITTAFENKSHTQASLAKNSHTQVLESSHTQDIVHNVSQDATHTSIQTKSKQESAQYWQQLGLASSDIALLLRLDLAAFFTHFMRHLARSKPFYLPILPCAFLMEHSAQIYTHALMQEPHKHTQEPNSSFPQQRELASIHCYAIMLNELDSLSMPLPTPPSIKDCAPILLRLQKRGVLGLEDIYTLAMQCSFLTHLQEQFKPLDNVFSAYLLRMMIPKHLIQELCIFDEKGALQEGRFPHIDSLHHECKSLDLRIAKALHAIMAQSEIAPYLVDTQIHFLYDYQALLLRAGYSKVLKGSVLERTQGGFFYILPDEIARLYEHKNQARDNLALEIYHVCERISALLQQEVRTLTHINKQFDVIDGLLARIAFARECDLSFIAPMAQHQAKSAKCDKSISSVSDEYIGFSDASHNDSSFILHDFCHPILRTPTPISIHLARPLLLLTGVNAGGKTMLLKSLLSAAFCAKHLIPMRLNPHHSHIPYYKHIYAIINEQSQNDISTFAARVAQCAQALTATQALIGIDEIELGTDANEAASLYKAVLEELLHKGNTLIITTHHKHLASIMAKDARTQLSAAMFDITSARATYSFLHGSIGKSYAFDIAQQYGIPPYIIERARKHYGEEGLHLNALIEKSSVLQRDLMTQKALLEQELQQARMIKESYSTTMAQLEHEYRTKVAELESTYNHALSALKARANTMQDIHRNMNRAHEILKSTPKASTITHESSLQSGDTVRYNNTLARLLSREKEHGIIELDSGMRCKVLLRHLQRATPLPSIQASYSLEGRQKAHVRLDLHGLRADEALEKLQGFLSDSLLAGFDEVLIVHGIGSGVLARIVRECLSCHPKVLSFTKAPAHMGGSGATLVRL